MSISTKFFTQQTISSFESLTDKINTAQAQVASGAKFDKASAAPIDAVKVSAFRERRDELSRYLVNINQVYQKLSQSGLLFL